MTHRWFLYAIVLVVFCSNQYAKLLAALMFAKAGTLQSFVRALHAGDNSQWSHLHNRIKSAIFLGTPHRGSEWANRLYFLFLGASVLRPGSSFVPLLRKGNSALLAAITERFNNAWGTRAVLSFCEEKSTGPLGLVRRSQIQ